MESHSISSRIHLHVAKEKKLIIVGTFCSTKLSAMLSHCPQAFIFDAENELEFYRVYQATLHGQDLVSNQLSYQMWLEKMGFAPATLLRGKVDYKNPRLKTKFYLTTPPKMLFAVRSTLLTHSKL